MSGRIRTIKPELLEDEKTAGLSDFNFRVFIGLLLVVDDYGNARASAPYLHGQIAWGTSHTPSDFEASLFLLEDIGIITTYRSRGQTYLHVTNWDKHQKVDKPGKPRVPQLGDPESIPEQKVITYLVQIGEDGPIKIGKTIDLDARLRRLQTGVPHKLVVRKTIDSNIETQLHKQFSHLKQTGEWFAPGDDLIAYIAQNDSSNDSRTIREGHANDSSNDSRLIPISDLDLRSGSPNVICSERSADAVRSEPTTPETVEKVEEATEATDEPAPLSQTVTKPEAKTKPKKTDLPVDSLNARELAAHNAIVADESLVPIVQMPARLARDLCITAPGVDLPLQISRAGAWLRANPAKTKKLGARFLLNWVTTEQDRGDTLQFSQAPHSGVFGKTTTKDPSSYACAAHRPLQLKPEPPPPTKEELEEIAAQFAKLEGIRE